MSNIHVITDADLDGAGSFLCVKYAYKNANITYQATTEKTFLEDISFFDFKKYDLVFICDLNLKKEEIKIVDNKNVIIFDHHAEHENNLKYYEKAKTIVKEYSSCTKLLYHTLKLESKLDDKQKLLIKIVDDYDSYQLKIPFSKQLDQVFWTYTGDRIKKFTDDFYEGFSGFNQFQKNALKIVENKIEKFFKEETIHIGNLKLGGKEYKIAGTFVTFSPNEIAERVIKTYNVDFIIMINMNAKNVYLRKNSKCGLNMGKLAEKLMDGGGHDDSAGGKLNETIINITKFLKPV